MDKQLRHFSNLVILANADNVLHPKEILFLEKISKRLNIDVNSFKEILAKPQEFDYDFLSEEVEKYIFLDDFLNLIMIDGKIHENEIVVCKDLSKKLGFSTIVVDDIIQRMIKHIDKGFNENVLTEEIKFDIYSLTQKNEKYDKYN